ncbi:hypothetical protein C7271_06125 [filamentous cyanobacterium CCP5]|nr:hypothetical protein C7271_06125 [filamentous cyanobacterium CCP5]
MAEAENGAIPLPSHIHYELLLQLLERETMAAVYQNPTLRTEVQDLIVTLRKAMVQQRQLEETCQQKQQSIDYRWSLNNGSSKPNN